MDGRPQKDLSRLKVGDQELAITSTSRLLRGVMKFYRLNVILVKQTSDFGNVVEGEHKLSADSP
jgi:hypothetical protein